MCVRVCVPAACGQVHSSCSRTRLCPPLSRVDKWNLLCSSRYCSHSWRITHAENRHTQPPTQTHTEQHALRCQSKPLQKYPHVMWRDPSGCLIYSGKNWTHILVPVLFTRWDPYIHTHTQMATFKSDILTVIMFSNEKENEGVTWGWVLAECWSSSSLLNAPR